MILDLPDELLDEIWTWLTAADLWRVARVCHRWHAVCRVSALWHRRLRLDYGAAAVASLTPDQATAGWDAYRRQAARARFMRWPEASARPLMLPRSTGGSMQGCLSRDLGVLSTVSDTAVMFSLGGTAVSPHTLHSH